MQQVMASIKRHIEQQLRTNMPTITTVTWKNDDILIADVDAIQDFELRVSGTEPPVHTMEQGPPQSPMKPKPKKNVRGYRRRTKRGVERVSSYQTQPEKPDYRQALEEMKAVEFETMERIEADEETNNAIKEGIDRGIDSFK